MFFYPKFLRLEHLPRSRLDFPLPNLDLLFERLTLFRPPSLIQIICVLHIVSLTDWCPFTCGISALQSPVTYRCLIHICSINKQINDYSVANPSHLEEGVAMEGEC